MRPEPPIDEPLASDLTRSVVQAVESAAGELVRRRVLAAALAQDGGARPRDLEEMHRFALGPLLARAHDALGPDFVDLLLPRIYAILEDAWTQDRASLDWADDASVYAAPTPPPDAYLPRSCDSDIFATSPYDDDDEGPPTVRVPRSA